MEKLVKWDSADLVKCDVPFYKKRTIPFDKIVKRCSILEIPPRIDISLMRVCISLAVSAETSICVELHVRGTSSGVSLLLGV